MFLRFANLFYPGIAILFGTLVAALKNPWFFLFLFLFLLNLVCELTFCTCFHLPRYGWVVEFISCDFNVYWKVSTCFTKASCLATTKTPTICTVSPSQSPRGSSPTPQYTYITMFLDPLIWTQIQTHLWRFSVSQSKCKKIDWKSDLEMGIIEIVQYNNHI